MHTSGFSLLELIIVIAIIAALSAVSLPLGISFFNRQSLEGVRTQLVEILQTARSNAVAQKNDSSFGVYFTSPLVSYTLYQGNSYGARNSTYDEAYTVPAGTLIEWTTPNIVAVSDINFAEHTGAPNATGTVAILNANTATTSILIDTSGNVTEQ